MKTFRHAIVLTACSVLALAIFGWPAAAGSDPAYLKIVVGPEREIIAQFMGSELRFADTEEDLKQAKAVKGKSQRGSNQLFQSVAIPAPKDGWQNGIKTVTGDFQLIESKSRNETRSILFGTLKASTGTDKAGWDYCQTIGVQLQADLKRAPIVTVPDPSKLSLKVTAQRKGDAKNIGIALSLTAGKAELSDIRKDGQQLKAKVEVLDSADKDVKTAEGYLSNFGFS